MPWKAKPFITIYLEVLGFILSPVIIRRAETWSHSLHTKMFSINSCISPCWPEGSGGRGLCGWHTAGTGWAAGGLWWQSDLSPKLFLCVPRSSWTEMSPFHGWMWAVIGVHSIGTQVHCWAVAGWSCQSFIQLLSLFGIQFLASFSCSPWSWDCRKLFAFHKPHMWFL